MQNNAIVFPINDTEKIVIDLKEPIAKIPYFYPISVIFLKGNKQIFRAKEDIDKVNRFY